jgi:hypothetical protein
MIDPRGLISGQEQTTVGEIYAIDLIAHWRPKAVPFFRLISGMKIPEARALLFRLISGQQHTTVGEIY